MNNIRNYRPEKAMVVTILCVIKGDKAGKVICITAMQSICGDDQQLNSGRSPWQGHGYSILQMVSSGFAIHGTSLTLHFSFTPHS